MTHWQPCAKCGKPRRLGTRRAHAECADCRKGYVPRRILRAFAPEMRRKIAWWARATRVNTDAGGVK